MKYNFFTKVKQTFFTLILLMFCSFFLYYISHKLKKYSDFTKQNYKHTLGSFKITKNKAHLGKNSARLVSYGNTFWTYFYDKKNKLQIFYCIQFFILVFDIGKSYEDFFSRNHHSFWLENYLKFLTYFFIL